MAKAYPRAWRVVVAKPTKANPQAVERLSWDYTVKEAAHKFVELARKAGQTSETRVAQSLARSRVTVENCK